MPQQKLAVQKMGSIKQVKASLKKGGGSGLIQGVPTDGVTVRFITEPDEWIGYYEWFDKEANMFVPLVQGEDLPRGVKPSHRYLTNAVQVSEGMHEDKVIALKLAKTLAISLMAKYDKYGTLLDRDYELDRIGEGFDTTYDVTPDAPSKRNLKKYEPLDLEGVLLGARASLDGDLSDDEEDEDETPARGAKSKGAAKRAAAAEPDDDEGDDESEAEAEVEDETDDDEVDDVEASMDVDFDLGTTVELADEGDDDAIERLYQWFADEETSVDPDEHETWAGAVQAVEGERARKARQAANAAKKAPAKKTGSKPAKATPKKRAAAEPEPEPDEEEEEAAEEEAIEIDEESLTAMSLAELRGLADEYGIAHKGLAKNRLVKAIMDAAEE